MPEELNVVIHPSRPAAAEPAEKPVVKHAFLKRRVPVSGKFEKKPTTQTVIEAPGIFARFTYWDAGGTEDLLLWSHGMQDPGLADPNARDIPPKNYAFTIPFDRALFNPSLTNHPDRLLHFLTTFFLSERRASFSSPAPLLYIYPFMPKNPDIEKTLQAISRYEMCDILYLTLLTNVPYITLADLLRAPLHGRRLCDKYSSILLLACRSDTSEHKIGCGGAAEAPADGLYSVAGQCLIKIP